MFRLLAFVLFLFSVSSNAEVTGLLVQNCTIGQLSNKTYLHVQKQPSLWVQTVWANDSEVDNDWDLSVADIGNLLHWKSPLPTLIQNSEKGYQRERILVFPLARYLLFEQIRIPC